MAHLRFWRSYLSPLHAADSRTRRIRQTCSHRLSDCRNRVQWVTDTVGVYRNSIRHPTTSEERGNETPADAQRPSRHDAKSSHSRYTPAGTLAPACSRSMASYGRADVGAVYRRHPRSTHASGDCLPGGIMRQRPTATRLGTGAAKPRSLAQLLCQLRYHTHSHLRTRLWRGCGGHFLAPLR